MSDLKMAPETIVVDYVLDEPPHKVWRALTEPELVAAWLAPNDIRADLGHRFQVETTAEPGSAGAVQCEVLAIEPDRSISYSWREAREEGPALDSRVTWIITPTFDGGTHLRLVHDGFALTSGRALALAGAGRSIGRALSRRMLCVLADAFRIAA